MKFEPTFSICPYLHALNDAGYKNIETREFSRACTYAAECYLLSEGKKCLYKGKCLIATFTRTKDE